MNIIKTKHGEKVDMDRINGDKTAIVAVFKSSDDDYIYATIDSLIEGGTPIETEGDFEGDDMEYIGTGFLV